MSSAEEKLHKLKVTELKELLAKHNLPQTGKKDDLIKRLLENHDSADGEDTEELTDPLDEVPAAAENSSEAAAGAGATTGQAEASADPAASAPSASDSAPPTLTPDQQAMKARAERFGVPFNPNPTPSVRSQPSKSLSSAATPATAAAASSSSATKAEPKPKAGAIDKGALGVSDELLAKRAARFGLPEKKVGTAGGAVGASDGVAAGSEVAPPTAPPSKKALQTADPEVTPEQAAKIAEDEEKKRKRAEKFGTAAAGPASNGTSEPDAKKAKV